MEIIKITQPKTSMGFIQKTETLEYQGVKFDDGTIAYQNEAGSVVVYDNTESLKKYVKGASVVCQSEPTKKRGRK